MITVGLNQSVSPTELMKGFVELCDWYNESNIEHLIINSEEKNVNVVYNDDVNTLYDLLGVTEPPKMEQSFDKEDGILKTGYFEFQGWMIYYEMNIKKSEEENNERTEQRRTTNT